LPGGQQKKAHKIKKNPSLEDAQRPGGKPNNCTGSGLGQKKWQHGGTNQTRAACWPVAFAHFQHPELHPLPGQPEAICSCYLARAVAIPNNIVTEKIIMIPAWTKKDPVTAGSGSAADTKHNPMNPIPVKALPILRIFFLLLLKFNNPLVRLPCTSSC
jgi:hypothetical protein